MMMASEIKVPSLGESVSEATIAKWLKNEGDYVNIDELLLELETDKVTLEVNAPIAGYLRKILSPEGSSVSAGAAVGIIDAAAMPAPGPTEAQAAPLAAGAPVLSLDGATQKTSPPAMPAAQKQAADLKVDLTTLAGTGRDGRITKGDVLMASPPGALSSSPSSPMALHNNAALLPNPAPTAPTAQAGRAERVKMSRLRQRIAERLKAAQNTAAILTTFNEIDMSAIIALRQEYKELFEKKHAVKLGFMSFFVKAAIEALREIPAINAEIDGQDIIYKNYYDIGVAVGTEQGLVVPVLRHAEALNLAEIEKAIADMGRKARDGKLTVADLQGGTFTISNGGVYGSLMSTPILNPPQSGILGMHKTQERPVAIAGKVEIRPMMYVALSYDHRIVDGKEAVTFLVRIKETLEDPRRLLLAL
jgi:2-oxoglutarate dehydrogenase E2 component (dihydrolipoamide succinyltransferase)